MRPAVLRPFPASHPQPGHQGQPAGKPRAGQAVVTVGRRPHHEQVTTAVHGLLHPDRLLPAEPGVRAVARELYDAVRELPVISPHGHVDPRLLLDDEPFGDPAALLVTPDHYVTRLLHAAGVGLDELGVGRGPLPEERARAGVAAAVLALGRLPRHAGALLAGVGAGGHLRRHAAPVGGDGRRDLRPAGRAAGRPTPTGPGRSTSGSGSRCWPPPTTRATTCPRTPRSRPTRPGRAG